MSGAVTDLRELYREIGPDLDSVSAGISKALASASPVVRELVDHVSRFRGKQVRAAMLFLCGRAAGEATPSHATLGMILELIHAATLVHDDILDGALMRRGVQSLNAAYGSEVSVLTGDLLFARAFVLIATLRNHHAAARLSEMCSRICVGEITQVRQRHNLGLTEEEYEEIVALKTASLFETGCELGSLFGGASEEESRALARFGRGIGIAFQIVDDCLDIDGDEAVVGKTLGTDAHWGKVTLPVIRLLKGGSSPVQREVERIFAEFQEAHALRGTAEPDRPEARARLRRLREILTQEGALEYAYDRAREHVDTAKALLAETFRPTPYRETLLELSDFVTRRAL